MVLGFGLRVSSGLSLGFRIWGFPKIMGTILGAPILRTIVHWGLYCGPPNLGNYHLGWLGLAGFRV